MASNPQQQKFGHCARCGSPNLYTNLHCTSCGARLPWMAMAPAALSVQPVTSAVKKWPLWASDERKIEVAVADLERFIATKWFMGVDHKTAFAVDEGTQKVCLIEAEKEIVRRHVFSYQDVLGSEIVEDGYILATTSGPAGGTAGQVSAGRKTPNVQTVAVKIIINQADTLLHIVKFLNKEQGRGSYPHKQALGKATQLHNLMIAIISLSNLMRRD